MVRIFRGINLVLLFLIVVGCVPYMAQKLANSLPPSTTFSEANLVGTWVGHYGYPWGTDKLILAKDMTFKQIYTDVKGYSHETLWNKWWVELRLDGKVRLHLEGARYYVGGVEMAELEGLIPSNVGGSPRQFFDPFGKGQDQWIEMVRKLVLNVRRVSSGDLVLVQMSHSTDPPCWEELVRVSTAETAAWLPPPKR